MSPRVDAERAALAREERNTRALEKARKVLRLAQLSAEGRTERQISEALGEGFSVKQVKRWQQALGLLLGRPAAGRWYKSVGRM